MSHCEIKRTMLALTQRLYPLHRSMTGAGVRATFDELNRFIPLTVHEVPTGTPIFDWTVPQEWLIRDAFIKNTSGERLVDYRRSNLHVVNNSMPVDTYIDWSILAPHIHSLPDRPETIPYRTAYLRKDWGFCIPHALLRSMSASNETFHVYIDSEHFDGSLSYAECTIPGESERSILIYCHTCHPSLANDNLSGIVVATMLAHFLQRKTNRFTYRFIFAPATIGAITWLAKNESSVVPLIDYGLVLSLLGNEASFTYKRSRQNDSAIDRIASAEVYARGGDVRKFRPFGYDERQFCSPGFDLAVGCLSRTPNGEFPEYHTSEDNLSFISMDRLLDALRLCETILQSLEESNPKSEKTKLKNDHFGVSAAPSNDGCPVRRFPKCEPFLGKYDLYRSYWQSDDRGRFQEAVMWVLNLSDGRHTLNEIATHSGIAESEILRAVLVLANHDLLEPYEVLFSK